MLCGGCADRDGRRRAALKGSQRFDDFVKAGLVEQVGGLYHGHVELKLFVGSPTHPGLRFREMVEQHEKLVSRRGRMVCDARDEKIAHVPDQIAQQPR